MSGGNCTIKMSNVSQLTSQLSNYFPWSNRFLEVSLKYITVGVIWYFPYTLLIYCTLQTTI